MLTTQMVKDWAIRCGADAVGIGAMERFEGAPVDYDPRYIFPEAQAIIGLAFRVHRGLYRGIEEGTWFSGLPSMGYANINDVFAPLTMRNLSSLIEDAGYEAVPYQNTSVRLGTNAGIAVAEGFPKPDVFIHFRIAAYICGMGEIGWSKVLLTPQFGPRQRFAFILTDAPLKPDPLMEPGTLCDRCKLCVRDCPGNAISKDDAIEVEIAGKQIAWGKLDEDKCACVYQTGSPEYGPFMDEETAANVQRLIDLPPGQERSEMIAYHGGPWGLGRNTPYSKNAWESFTHPGTVCGARGCQRACFIHLEEQGKLTNKFHRPFRIRKPWRLGSR